MPDQCMVSSQNPDYYVGECAEFLHRTHSSRALWLDWQHSEAQTGCVSMLDMDFLYEFLLFPKKRGSPPPEAGLPSKWKFLKNYNEIKG